MVIRIYFIALKVVIDFDSIDYVVNSGLLKLIHSAVQD